MGFLDPFKRLFGWKDPEYSEPEETRVAVPDQPEPQPEPEGLPMTDDEREEVATIVAIIAAGSRSDSKYQVKRIIRRA